MEHGSWHDWVGKVIHKELCQILTVKQTSKCTNQNLSERFGLVWYGFRFMAHQNPFRHINKVGDLSRGRPEGCLFNSYNSEV